MTTEKDNKQHTQSTNWFQYTTTLNDTPGNASNMYTKNPNSNSLQRPVSLKLFEMCNPKLY